VVPGDIVDLRFNNAGILRTDGVDAQAQMSFDTTLGKFGLQTAATYILHYEQANTPAGQLISTRNRESNPLALNLMGSASWKRGPVVARLGLRRASGYWNMETQPATRVGSWTTTDVGLGYAFGAADSAATQPAEVSLHCSNVFNQYPPFSANIAANIGYDPENGDLTGRVCSLALHVSFSTAGTTRQDLLQ
jgi:hypothetical protein